MIVYWVDVRMEDRKEDRKEGKGDREFIDVDVVDVVDSVG